MCALTKARAPEGGDGLGGRGAGASGYNFPLFLVYPVDMPGEINHDNCLWFLSFISFCLVVCVFKIKPW